MEIEDRGGHVQCEVAHAGIDVQRRRDLEAAQQSEHDGIDREVEEGIVNRA